ncbi:Transmembrane protein 185B [Hondaea fermentalgiana]|uniref:Transmembrane protein 185B n=1 Tax=Hondaea fermentalgiana TaxID=2315210 RepID=A0A2R5GLK0_9STRA|nr:Transmembrane protein 185B [Hondaea fermentalgiana]|eukprot:GBG31189.1 Transmembrane protein 185B [Hondaea fermentalgiana]
MGNDTPFGIDSSYIGSRRSSVVSAKLASAAPPGTDRATVNEADAQATPGHFAPCREKAVYLQQIYDYEERVRLAAMEVIINEEIREISAFRARTERRIRAISWDLTTPMIGICPLLLFILVALSMDGRLDGSIWVIMTPLFFLFGLFAVGICMGAVLYLRSSKSDSLFYGMYPNYRGFIQFWMHKVFREEPVAMCSGVVLYVSLVLFVIFIGMRVEASTTWPWMAIFSPFWIMLLIFALSPVLRWCGAHEDMDDFKTPYLVLMFSVWLPVTVFAIALPLYLDRYVSVSIAVVLIPLWVFEGELLIFLFVTLAQSLYTRKDISDSLLVVVVMLVIFAPLVAFQVLLVIKFDAAGEPLTWMEVFTPLFVWFSICTLYLINVTVYDEAPSRADLSMTHPKMLEKMSLQLAANNTRGNAAGESSSSSSRLGPPLPRHRGVSIAAPETVRRSASERARASRAASSSRP